MIAWVLLAYVLVVAVITIGELSRSESKLKAKLIEKDRLIDALKAANRERDAACVKVLSTLPVVETPLAESPLTLAKGPFIAVPSNGRIH